MYNEMRLECLNANFDEPEFRAECLEEVDDHAEVRKRLYIT